MKAIKQIYGLVLATCAMLSATALFAHGESTPGPHEGYIRMPGAFHVEVTPQKNRFNIYLLDINFQHPTNVNSSLKVTMKDGKSTKALACIKKTDYFTCTAEGSLMKRANELTVLAIRENARGSLVSYPLPLSREEK